MKFKDWIINGFPNSMLWFIVVTFVLYVMNLNIIAVLLSLTFFVFSIFYFIYNLPFQNKKKSIVIFLNLLFSAFFAFFVVLFEFADPEGIIVPIWLFASLFYILININVLTKRTLKESKNNHDYDNVKSNNNEIEHHKHNIKNNNIKVKHYLLFTILDNIFAVILFIWAIFLIIDDLGSSGLGSGWVAIGLSFWGIIAFIIWYILNLKLIKLIHNKKSFIKLSTIMIFIQLVVFIPVVYFSYDDIVDDMRSKRDNDILSKAQSYEDCENIHSYTSKEKCANNIFDDINDIVGCVQLIASVKNVSSFKCDGIEYDSSWYYRLDEVEEYHFKIKQEQLEEEIELAKQDIFLTVRDNEGFIARTLELGCNEKQYHRVKVDNKYEKYYRPCNSECQYDMRLNVNKEVTEFEKMTNLDKEEACLAKKDYFQNKVDNFNQDKLSKLSSNKTLVTLKELLDYFYSYHLDRCIYSYGLNTVEINNQLRNGILDFNYLTAISNRYFIDGITIHPPNNTVSSYGCEGYGLVDYIEYEALINKYKD